MRSSDRVDVFQEGGGSLRVKAERAIVDVGDGEAGALLEILERVLPAGAPERGAEVAAALLRTTQ